MFKVSLLSILSLASIVTAEVVAPNALNVQITANRSFDISPTLYGWMWEDINHSGDGGLYGELLQNRAFQSVVPGTSAALNAWVTVNGGFASVTSKTKGVSNALPNSLQLDIPKTPIKGQVGVANTGFWGIKIQKEWTYSASFWAKAASFSGPITVSLKSKSGTVFATHTVTGLGTEWKKFTFQMTPSATAPDGENLFSVTVDGTQAAGKTIFMGMFSLFPPTFRGRENGMRIDLAEMVIATKPSFWRFPGGNNLEGNTIATRWKWNETIGPLENRPGRPADWSYPNTDGLGLMEYLNWIEDLGAEPILGIYSGISTQNYSDLGSWQVVPESDIQPFVDEAIAEIEFITGDAKTNPNAAMRAKLGREEPFKLRFVEIGNEDTFQPGSYGAYRWSAFQTALSSRFPHLQFLATSDPTMALTPMFTKVDFHQYNSPNWFTNIGAFMFDNYPRNGTQFFVGEYAVISTNDTNAFGTFAQGRLPFPTLVGSVAEAAFMAGMERNSDVVFAAAYAPSMQHLRNWQWTPDIISFDATTAFASTSYYVQQMFSSNRGTQVLATVPAPTNDTIPLHWVASHNNDTNVVVLKVANTGNNDLVMRLAFDFNLSTFMTATSLSQTDGSGIFNLSNTPENTEAFIPVHGSFAVPDPKIFNWTFPAQSVSVLSFPIAD